MVEIAEPMTMITDYLITVFTTILAVLIFHELPFGIHPGIFMAISLIATGLGSLFGGSAHGFKPSISQRFHDFIWLLTTYSIGLATFFFEIAVITSSFLPNILVYVLIVISTLQLILYLIWMFSHTEFMYVIVNYALALLLILAMKIYSWIVFGDPSSIWIFGGILVSLIAASIQALEISPHDTYFNHNDLFHIVQLPAFYLLYKAALLLPT